MRSFGKETVSLLVLFLAVAVCIGGCCSVARLEPCLKDGKEYGGVSGWYSGEWWEMYEAALSYADGKCWDKAEEYFKKSMVIKPEDKWRIRTAAMRYTDWGYNFLGYFPNRELGIVYYHRRAESPEYIEMAKERLICSLSSEESEKAKECLRRVLRYEIERAGADRAAPGIELERSETGLYLTNAGVFRLAGSAGDDLHVGEIEATSDRGEKAFLKSDVFDMEKKRIAYRPRVSFSMQVPLKPGENRIRVVSRDLSGKESETATVAVCWDMLAPSLHVSLAPVQKDEGDSVSLHIDVSDDFGLKEIMVADRRPVPLHGEKEFQVAIDVEPAPGRGAIALKALDSAGNESVFNLRRELVEGLLAHSPGPPRANDREEPEIIVFDRDKNEPIRTFDKQAFVQGYAQDDIEVVSISIGDETRTQSGRKFFAFSAVVPMEEPGIKELTITARDGTEKEDREIVKIVGKTRAVHRVGSRLRVGLGEFERVFPGKKRAAPVWSENAESVFLEVMQELERFLPSSDENGSSEVKVFCKIEEREDGLEAYAELVDLETELILGVRDAFQDGLEGEAPGSGAMNDIMTGINLGFNRDVPLLEAKIVSFDDNELEANIGRRDGLKKGMKLLVYMKAEKDAGRSGVDVFPEDGCRILGIARVVDVSENSCLAKGVRLDRRMLRQEIYAITK